MTTTSTSASSISVTDTNNSGKIEPEEVLTPSNVTTCTTAIVSCLASTQEKSKKSFKRTGKAIKKTFNRDKQ